MKRLLILNIIHFPLIVLKQLQLLWYFYSDPGQMEREKKVKKKPQKTKPKNNINRHYNCLPLEEEEKKSWEEDGNKIVKIKAV